MRVATIVIVSLLLASPLAMGLQIRAPAQSPAVELTDAQLMLLLARLDRPMLMPLPQPVVAPGTTLPDVLARVGTRAQAPLAPADLAAFGALDPRVSAPLITLFVAIESAWDAYDRATADLSQSEIDELLALRAAGELASPRGRELVGEIDQETLIAAAIMVTDVVESIVVPQLLAAADNGAWPAAGRWDPVGVLRLGSTGNDFETLDRIVQIDPRGDDTYTNNAGGVTILDAVLNGRWNVLSPIAVSIDLSGNDRYPSERSSAALGASVLGIGFGLLLDLAGDDFYSCDGGECLGSGLALVRDYGGNDRYEPGDYALGMGEPLAIMRDDAGDDFYQTTYYSTGYADLPDNLGLLLDRGGSDYYAAWVFVDKRLGWGDEGGRGWMVDEGAGSDTYETNQSQFSFDNHGCDDCTWEMGTGINGEPPGGQGNDNRGGLAHLLSKQDSVLRQLP